VIQQHLDLVSSSFYRSKLHDELRIIQRSFDDNKGVDKKLKVQEPFMITKMMISRIKE